MGVIFGIDEEYTSRFSANNNQQSRWAQKIVPMDEATSVSVHWHDR
jgi:hypothetical protein